MLPAGVSFGKLIISSISILIILNVLLMNDWLSGENATFLF